MTIKELMIELEKYPEDFKVNLFDSDTEGYIYSREAYFVDKFEEDGIVIG